MTIQCSNNKHWVWLALDAETREIVGVHIGDRDEQQPESSGNFYPQCIDSVQLLTRIFGMLMEQ